VTYLKADWDIGDRVICLTCSADITDIAEPIAAKHLHHMIIIPKTLVWGRKGYEEEL